MRFHVYTDARHIDGEVAAGHTLTVYEEEAGSTAATLYSAATGADELANPYTVPGTGIIDLWTTCSTPWVLAQGDTVIRPLPVLPRFEKAMFTPEGGLAVRLTNGTGGASVKGELVHPSSSADNAVVKVPKGEPDTLGAFYESGVADGDEAWVVISGIVDVYFVGSTTHGHLARTFVAADNDYVIGQAKSEAIPTAPFATDKHFCEIGHVLQSRTGAGLAKIIMHFN